MDFTSYCFLWAFSPFFSFTIYLHLQISNRISDQHIHKLKFNDISISVLVGTQGKYFIWLRYKFESIKRFSVYFLPFFFYFSLPSFCRSSIPTKIYPFCILLNENKEFRWNQKKWSEWEQREQNIYQSSKLVYEVYSQHNFLNFVVFFILWWRRSPHTHSLTHENVRHRGRKTTHKFTISNR